MISSCDGGRGDWMKRLWSALAVMLFLLLTAIAPVTRAADLSSFTTIDVPGATSTHAIGINDTGQVAGWFKDAGGKEHGFLRTSMGAFTTIDVPGALLTHADGINGPGQIVGWFRDASGKEHGFIRNTAGDLATIDVPSASVTWVYSINTAGQIVGGFVDAGRKGHGFLRTGTGAFTTIDVPGATDTIAYGINDAGQIVGGFVDAGRKYHGFLRTVDGAFATIDVRGATATFASGIDNAGHIVGYFADASGKRHEFVRWAEAIFVFPPDVPGATEFIANSINSAGQIGGWFVDADGREHGIVLALSPAGAQQTSADHLIVSGQRIGSFKLGASMHDLSTALEFVDQTPPSNGIFTVIWSHSSVSPGFELFATTYRAECRDDSTQNKCRLLQIAILDDPNQAFATADGLHIGASEKQVRDVLGEPSREIRGEQHIRTLLYSSGIWFEVRENDGEYKVTGIGVRAPNCLEDIPCG